MNWLLIIYVMHYPLNHVPVIERFETEHQCRVALAEIISGPGYYKDSKCIFVGDAK